MLNSSGWSTRLKGSFKGIIFGISLFGIGCFVLWSNEKNAIQTKESLQEISSKVIEIQSDKVLSENEGKLVFVSGVAKTNDEVIDSETGFYLNTLVLSREVEMYQWIEKQIKETATENGKEVTHSRYEYQKEWLDKEEDSAKFNEPEKYKNPEMKYETKKFYAKDVSFGAFKLQEKQIHYFSPQKEVIFENGAFQKLNPEMKKKGKILDQVFYFVFDRHKDTIGDYRLKYKSAKNAQEISLIGVQKGEIFVPYISKEKQEIFLLKEGIHSKEGLILSAEKENKSMTWIKRVLGFFLIFIALNLLTKVLVVIAEIIPALGVLVSTGFNIINGLIAGAISLCIVGFARFVYQPHLALYLVGLAGLAFVMSIVIKKKKLNQ
ncbi:MAG: TMEM43 family protein [Alphaproteobacteria bacterium]|nr:TMEM43 family protein [Alphaproteobacteria bacterium]